VPWTGPASIGGGRRRTTHSTRCRPTSHGTRASPNGRLDLLRACWAYFDDVAARVSEELRPGSRSAGRSRDQIIRHVYANEPEQWSRKVGVRTERDVVLSPNGLARHRQEFLDAIRAFNAEGKPARTWPLQFLVRRTAHHVMDHAWEMEDRDLASQAGPATRRPISR